MTLTLTLTQGQTIRILTQRPKIWLFLTDWAIEDKSVYLADLVTLKRLTKVIDSYPKMNVWDTTIYWSNSQMLTPSGSNGLHVFRFRVF